MRGSRHNSRNDRNNLQREIEMDEFDEFDNNPSAPPIGDVDEDETWNCAMCTYENPWGLRNCEMCEHPRPVRSGGQGHSRTRTALDQMQSIRGIFSGRDVYKANVWKDHDTQPYIKKMIIYCFIMFILYIGALVAADSGLLVVGGDFGDEGLSWNYGYGGREKSGKKKDDFHDVYTKYYVKDARNFTLFSFIISFFALLIASIMLCYRYSDETPLFYRICGIRIPQRSTIDVLLETIVKRLFGSSLMFWCWGVGIVGTFEVNYYLTYNCDSGATCFAYFYPNWGMIFILLIICILVCVIYPSLTKIDPPLSLDTVKDYYDHNKDKVKKNTSKFKLPVIIDAQDHCRKIIMNCLSLFYMQNCGLLFLGVNTSESVISWQPFGWYNLRQVKKDNIVTLDADNLNSVKTAAVNLGSCISIVAWTCLFVYFYLMRVVVTFGTYKFFKFIYLLVITALLVIWCYTFGFFYFSFISYWNSKGADYLRDIVKSQIGTTDENNYYRHITDSSSINIYWTIDPFGFILVLFNLYYLARLLFKGSKGLGK